MQHHKTNTYLSSESSSDTRETYHTMSESKDINYVEKFVMVNIDSPTYEQLMSIPRVFGQHIRVYTDTFHEWATVVIHDTKTNKFVLFHNYIESRIDTRYLIEGNVGKDNKVIVDRFYFKPDYSEDIFTSVSQDTKTFHPIPCTFLGKVLGVEVAHEFDTSSPTPHQWVNPDKLFSWFDEMSTSCDWFDNVMKNASHEQL